MKLKDLYKLGFRHWIGLDSPDGSFVSLNDILYSFILI